MTDLKTNVLYYGDNLDILSHHIPPYSSLLAGQASGRMAEWMQRLRGDTRETT